MRYVYSLLVIWLCVMVGCKRDRELELGSTSPDRTKTVSIFLEHGLLDFKPTLVLVMEDEGRKRVLRKEDIARATSVHAMIESYDVGICCAEVVWPSSSVAVVLVKNCLGSIKFAAYDFHERRLGPGGKYADSMRKALAERYRKEIGESDGDPLTWVQGAGVDRAYRWKKLGNGRLMGGS